MRVLDRKAILSVFVVGLATFAGCVDSGSPESLDPKGAGGPATFTDTTGAVEGIVVDAESLPVPSAQVALRGPEKEMSTTTDERGTFGFSNVPVGTYDLFVQRLGYESAGQRIDVEAGAASTAEVTITRLAIEEPYVVSMQQSGMVGCGVSVRPVVGVAVCGAVTLVGDIVGVNLSAYDQFLLVWPMAEPTEGWQAGLLETTWQSNQALGRGLSVNWEVNGCPNDDDETFADGSGPSPLRLEVDKERIDEVIENAADGEEGCGESAAEECNEDQCNTYTRVFATAETTGLAADVGIVFQQRYDMYMTAFFHQEMPDGYTGAPDA